MECLLFRPHPHKQVYVECWRGKKACYSCSTYSKQKNSLNQGVKMVLHVRSKNTYFIFRFRNLVYETLPKRNFRP